MKKLIYTLIVISLSSCARPISPTGGPKDTTPPKVVAENSTPNLQTRFEERSFKISFDEWVTLQDVVNQVLVSPPLAKRPEVTLKGRTVTFKFDPEEVLRENTTYTINFGTAVKDLHEGNPAEDLRFVFSTGDVIDSLSVKGAALDAFTGDPVEKLAVLLYDIFEDSIVMKERPYYMARTDKSGQFSIQNVRAGRFKVVVIDDVKQNLKWDGAAERIGFPDTLILVNDSLKTIPPVRIFQEQSELRLQTRNIGRYGLIGLGFSGPPDTVSLAIDQAEIRWMSESDGDSLLIWYDRPVDSTAWKLIAGTDTIAIRALSRSEFLETNKIRFGDESSPATPASSKRGRLATTTPAATPPPPPPRTVTVNTAKPVEIPFNNPLVSIDTSRCLFVADSVETRDFGLVLDSSKRRLVRLDVDWVPEVRYTLKLLPGALTDFYGVTNTDTLRRQFTVPAEKQLSTLNLSVESLEPGTAYVLSLLNGAKVEEERKFTADSSVVRFVFSKLQPIAYTIQLIEDQNGNGRWDPGNYFLHRQPERIFSKKQNALRANWEVEAFIEARAGGGKRKISNE